MRIPIFQGERHLGFVRDAGTLRRYSDATNVKLVRKRGTILRIEVTAVPADPDTARGIGPNSVMATYEDSFPTGPLTTLKRINPDGHFERWGADDGFNPRRFNPDQVASSAVRCRA
jgi:hypothetical protein